MLVKNNVRVIYADLEVSNDPEQGRPTSVLKEVCVTKTRNLTSGILILKISSFRWRDPQNDDESA
jgi:hypothetical protein